MNSSNHCSCVEEMFVDHHLLAFTSPHLFFHELILINTNRSHKSIGQFLSLLNILIPVFFTFWNNSPEGFFHFLIFWQYRILVNDLLPQNLLINRLINFLAHKLASCLNVNSFIILHFQNMVIYIPLNI